MMSCLQGQPPGFLSETQVSAPIFFNPNSARISCSLDLAPASSLLFLKRLTRLDSPFITPVWSMAAATMLSAWIWADAQLIRPCLSNGDHPRLKKNLSSPNHPSAHLTRERRVSATNAASQLTAWCCRRNYSCKLCSTLRRVKLPSCQTELELVSLHTCIRVIWEKEWWNHTTVSKSTGELCFRRPGCVSSNCSAWGRGDVTEDPGYPAGLLQRGK
ncbi:uncharacterized protein LOC127382641 [Apus apus]|uniref:uncharacterized protein LOC127382641 n=1 Tax=Apus apus TaxID=8895 RepID=UPI0021F8CD07|nr:uncharacterized protein LOC127382641 [Apus apus]